MTHVCGFIDGIFGAVEIWGHSRVEPSDSLSVEDQDPVQIASRKILGSHCCLVTRTSLGADQTPVYYSNNLQNGL